MNAIRRLVFRFLLLAVLSSVITVPGAHGIVCEDIFESKDQREAVALSQLMSFAEKTKAEYGLHGAIAIQSAPKKILSPLLKTWARSERIRIDQLSAFIDQLYAGSKMSSFPDSPKNRWRDRVDQRAQTRVRRHWEAALYQRGLEKALFEAGLLDMSAPRPWRESAREMIKTSFRLLFGALPAFQMQPSQLQRLVESGADEAIRGGSRSAYDVFAARIYTRAQAEVVWEGIRWTMSRVAMLLIVSHLLATVDEQIFPLEGMISSREKVLDAIVEDANREYEVRYGDPLSAGAQREIRAQFGEFSYRALLLEMRKNQTSSD